MPPLEQAGIEFVSMGFADFIKNIGEASKAIATMGRMTENRLKALREFNDMLAVTGKMASDYAASSRDVEQSNDRIADSADRATNALSGIGKGIGKWASVGSTIGGLVGTLVPGLGNVLGAAVGGLTGALLKFQLNIIESIINAWKNGMKKLASIVPAILKPIANVFMWLGNVALGAIKGLVSAIGSLFQPADRAAGGFRGLSGSIFEAMFKFEVLKQVIRRIINDLKEMAQASFQAAITLQTLTIRLDNLIARQIRASGVTQDYDKSIALASIHTQELLGWIQQLALATPFSEETISETVSLAMAMGWGIDSTKELTTAILNYSAAQGLSNDVMERIIYNFAQMRQAGKVTGTELRDLARGAFMPVNTILDEAASMLGIAANNMEQFRQAAADGSIDIETFFQAFINVVNREFPDAARRMNYTFSAVMDNVRDLFRILLGWNILTPTLDSISRSIQRVVEAFNTPEIMNNTKLIGIGLKYVYEQLSFFASTVVNSFRQVAQAMGLTLPTIDDVLMAIARVGAFFGQLGSILENFVANQVVPLIRDWSDKFKNFFGDLPDNMYTWGWQTIVQFAAGIIRGAATALTAAMNFISSLLQGWLQPHSPPRIAPDIDLWGMQTMAEWLHGFTEADFSILDSVQDSLKGALGALVDLGLLDENVVGDMFAEISASLMEALDALNRTGTIGSWIFDELRSVAGVFGTELASLLQMQLDLADATERVAAAQRAYNEAVERARQSTKTVNALVKAYNTLLRGGAGKQTLAAKLRELNIAELKLDADRKAQVAAEDQLKASEAMIGPLKEAVQLQERLIKQLIELAQAQKEAAEAASRASRAGGGAGAGEPVGEPAGLEIPKIPKTWDAGGLDLEKRFKEIRKLAEEELAGLWKTLGDIWNKEMAGIFGDGGTLTTAWGTFLDTLKRVWDEKIAEPLNLPTVDEIMKEWEDPSQGILSRIAGIGALFIDSFLEGKGAPKGKATFWDSPLGQTLWDILHPDFKQIGTDMRQALITAIFDAVTGLFQSVQDVFNEFVYDVLDFFGIDVEGNGSRTMADIGTDLVLGLGKGIEEKTVWLSNAVAGIGGFLNDFVDRVLDFFGVRSPSTLFSDIGEDLVAGLKNGFETAFETFTNGIGRTLEGLASTISSIGIVDDFEAIGASWIQGIINGIDSMMDDLEVKMAEVGNKAKGSTESVTQTASPSKVFMRIGEDWMRGLAIGVSKGAGMVHAAVSGAAYTASPMARMASSHMAAPMVSGGSTLNFGDVHINNGMDWAIFKSQVQRAVLED